MSRLIDADVLLEHIKKLECHAENKKYEQGMNDFLQCYFPQIIDNQPTAFDTKKIVEQLKETRKTALNKVKMPIMIVCKHDLQEFADICFEESIDIVKKGGVE